MNKSSTATSAYHITDASIDVRPITPAIGAEIHGIQLSGDLPAKTVIAIRDALLRDRVVFFRGQGHLDEVEHQAFASLLARIMHDAEDFCGDSGGKRAIHVANRCSNELPRVSTLCHSHHDRRYAASVRSARRPPQENHR
jgi:alpha-ketoglutarate-dependent taurine dioxygenase